jgi:hypothetical protein
MQSVQRLEEHEDMKGWDILDRGKGEAADMVGYRMNTENSMRTRQSWYERLIVG